MNSKYTEIRDIILKHIDGAGNFSSSIKGLRLVRRDEPTEFLKCFYNPTCILVLQGQKHMIYGEENLIYGAGQYVISCTDIPVSSRVAKASKNEPFVVLILELEADLISQLILETKQKLNVEKENKSLAIANTDSALLDAFYRLALLLDKPQTEQDVLSPIIIKEIYFRLLTGPLGKQLQLINTKGTRSNQIVQAIQILKDKYTDKLNMDEIAERVNMAPSSFYRNFKKVTKVSPLQYQKQLRLNEAQRLMLSQNYDATTACYEVGYESPTQFNREYKKMFGNPPKSDIKKLVGATS